MGIYIIDRFEDNIAVLESEDGSHIDVPIGELPAGIHEGDSLEKTESGFIFREDLTGERRERIKEKQKRLFRHRTEE
ncbi:MAG: DUF3006 domain-containing protein [Oscillospiraceae bacterium]|nr:DUF3006 domain-containing protein [Oscillospiraceae bacterium]